MRYFNTLLIAALLAGVAVGLLWPGFAGHLSWLGDLYLSLLMMVLLPLVILSILYAFCQSGTESPLRILGRGGLFYLFSSLLAGISGVLLFWLIAPAAEWMPPSDTHTPIAASIDWIELLIPTNLFGALAQGQILPVILFCLLFGIALAHSSDTAALAAPLGVLHGAIMRLTGWIVLLTPLGGFALIAQGVSQLGEDLPATLALLIGTVLIAALWHSFINLPLLARLFGARDLWRYLRTIKKAPLTALATASSAATLPVSLQAAQEAGIRRQSSALLLPLGASLNMDGSALYHAVVVLFLALLSGLELGVGGSIVVVGLVMLSSAGTSAIPGGGIAMLAMIATLLGIDPVWLGLYLLIDRFLDNIITSVNVWGDLVALKSVDQSAKMDQSA